MTDSEYWIKYHTRCYSKSKLVMSQRAPVAEMMVKFGGSFVRHLGEALMLADRDNARIIHDAFPEYWMKYHSLYQKEEEVRERENRQVREENLGT